MNDTNIIVPELPESISNAVIIQWCKKQGDSIKTDDILVELETDKVVLEIPATINGILKTILVKQGETVKSQQIIGILEEIALNDIKYDINKITDKQTKNNITNNHYLSPSLRRKNNYDILNNNQEKHNEKINIKNSTTYNITRVPMSPIRQKITQQLMLSKNNTVMLTTFNEVNMQKINKIRNKYNVLIQEKYNFKLGFMSFYIKAVTQSLQIYPQINAYIDNNDIIYNNFYHINIAIATKRGLLTPIIKDTDKIPLLDIEKKIKELVLKSNTNQLSIDDLNSGTFTITNGGVFGSLMSTPIINPPQSAILGIHAIKDRPIVIKEKICIMPMTYLALSYDHRLIDGKEAIGFLNNIKSLLEEPLYLLMQI
ncbi:2-oxo acid dehydrogenase subunit E2 [Enterobacteriaceae endosymbiont of Neohaemonia nigricornis]|uniref:2-oxo acid dehydrogenase subunit E2 n=1 Tax=Enterobacteriaceae endosymbiont of Neohaemonia nigricornis TaxID=2675792 RepID=UPI001448B836|nr:2-oxo acid dehydrogenase subunit E2 [Enterobacteriaceae endosymbiont of Neohaemonia nigricornis]QJC30395.1 dihydrolipoamide succinyltransferase [Enterobacteriaceae endosymbiont of Neohaemonia nigricornis]